MDLLAKYACWDSQSMFDVVQKRFILSMKMPTQSFRDVSIREMGRRLLRVLLSAFLGIGTSYLHFQKMGVDLCLHIAHSRACTCCAVVSGHRAMRLYVTPESPAEDCHLL